MTVEATVADVQAAGFDILALVGVYLDVQTIPDDTQVPAVPVEALYLGAVTALAAVVQYLKGTADDLATVGALFAPLDAVPDA